jgi:hypothetical protein
MGTAATTDLVRIGAKLYAENPERIDLGAYVPIFHGWIQARNLDGLPIDVADYAHVPDGPGILLIGHEADRAIDMGEGRPGALYQRKRDGAGALEERFAAAIAGADEVARRIESEPSADGVRFGRDEIQLRINDRFVVPNDEGGLEALRPALEGALAAVRPGKAATIERVAEDPRGPLTLRVLLG